MRIENAINIMIAPAFHVCLFFKTITLKPTNQNGYCLARKRRKRTDSYEAFSNISVQLEVIN